MNRFLSEATPTRRKIRAIAWILLGVSLLLAAFELWLNSPASETPDFDPFGLVEHPEGLVIFLAVNYGLWLLVGATDLVFAIVLKGRRNRSVLLGGFVALLVPVGYIVWMLNF